MIGSRLVRVCPVCKQQISERTNEEGLVSNNFADRYESEHREHERERQQCYVLALQPHDDGAPRPGPQALPNVSHLVLDLVKEQMPDVDWHLVHDLHDIPERAPVLDAGHVLRGAWQREGDNPQLWQVRWYPVPERSDAHRPTGDRSWGQVSGFPGPLGMGCGRSRSLARIPDLREERDVTALSGLRRRRVKPPW